jgi:hypothetical protein
MELASVSAPTSLAGSATAMPLIVSPDQFGAAGPGDFLAGDESREARASSHFGGDPVKRIPTFSNLPFTSLLS